MSLLISPRVFEWNDRVVPRIAKTILQDSRWDAIPILADAMEEAGFTDCAVLAQLRRANLRAMQNQPAWHRAYQQFGGLREGWEVQLACLLAFSQEGRWTIPMLPLANPCNCSVTALRGCGVTVFSFFDNLDAGIGHNDRDPVRDGPYAVSIKAATEADEENANLSADDCRQRGISGTTLDERLRLGNAYFLVTGRHLDAECVTQCPGSRYRDGPVPCVDWNPDGREVRVWVCWCSAGLRSDCLRSRSVRALTGEKRESVPERA